MHVYDSVSNQTSFLGNTTETYFRISSLQPGHNYTFSVQARCLVGGQLCGEAALLLYDQLTGTHTHTHTYTRTQTHSNSTSRRAGDGAAAPSGGQSGDVAAVVVPLLLLLLLAVCGGLVLLYLRHRRLQNNFTAFANSHYNSRLGSAIFSSGDELGEPPFALGQSRPPGSHRPLLSLLLSRRRRRRRPHDQRLLGRRSHGDRVARRPPPRAAAWSDGGMSCR